jgi:lipid-binding SYLF domain-containing protein
MTVAVRLLDDHKRMPEVHRVHMIAGPLGHRGDRHSVAGRSPDLLEVARFACAFLDGATLRPDNDANQRLYNRNITSKEIALDGKVAPPSAAKELLSELNERSPKYLSR